MGFIYFIFEKKSRGRDMSDELLFLCCCQGGGPEKSIQGVCWYFEIAEEEKRGQMDILFFVLEDFDFEESDEEKTREGGRGRLIYVSPLNTLTQNSTNDEITSLDARRSNAESW